MGIISGTGQAVSGLGGAAGYGETALSRGDDVFFQLDLSAVFGNRIAIGGVAYSSNSVFLSTDGYITFGQAPLSLLPLDPLTLSTPFIAPFMADIDTRLDGEGPESGPIWLDLDANQGVVTITWQDVGFYRRNASLTNTFQLQLFKRADGSFDTVFRYEDINWVSGDLQSGFGGLGGAAAFVGFKNASATQVLAASGNETALLGLATAIGNTGQAGLWVYSPAISIRVDGTVGSDTLCGTSGNDTLNGFDGDDVFIVSDGADVLNGGNGFDIASYETATSVLIDLSGTIASAGAAFGDTFAQFEGIASGAFNDTLIGNDVDNRFFSGDGNDVLFGGNGNDVLSGGAGIDILYGGPGSDTLIGGAGFDVVTYRSALTAIRFDMANPATNTGDAAGDVLIEIESLRGTPFNDDLFGDSSANTLRGDLGNDSLFGGLGADSLIGGEGDDLIEGGEGADFLNGHIGMDRVSYRSASNGITIDLINPALNTGDAFGDTILNFEVFIGSFFNDRLSGDSLENALFGLSGDDVLSGMAGNDTLRGGPGADLLFGGDGADRFVFSVGTGMIADSVADYALGAGDTLEIIGASTVNQFSAVSSNIPNMGSASVADVMLTYLPTNQVICTLSDLGSGSALSIYLNGNEYFLYF